MDTMKNGMTQKKERNIMFENINCLNLYSYKSGIYAFNVVFSDCITSPVIEW